MKINKKILLVFAGFVFNGLVWGQTNPYGISDADGREIMAMIKSNHLANVSLAYKAAVIPRMLEEVNYLSERLNLPMPHPIQNSDIKSIHVTPPWYSGIDSSTLNTNILSPIARIREAKVTIRGVVETTNFIFSLDKGKLLYVCRMENGNNYINDARLDEWRTKPSLINSNQAYQLATQWLAAVDMDMAALNGLKWTIHQLRYLPLGATNAVEMPFYYVDFESQHFHSENMDSDEPLIEVKILGTTKELMELRIGDQALSHRPQMTVTNALELASIPDPPIKQLQGTMKSQTNAPLSP